MSVLGIDQVTYGVDDLPTCRRFLLDWGLALAGEGEGRLIFETLNGCRVILARRDDPALPPAFEEGPTLRDVVWGVAGEDDLHRLRDRLAGQPGFVGRPGLIGCADPNGLAIRLQVTRKRAVAVRGVPLNTWDHAARVDTPSAIYDRAEPVEVGHVVVFTDRLAELEAFYTERLGFRVSDRYPGRGVFLRAAPAGGHHDLFLLQVPGRRRGLNHVAFTVRDIHEVFGGGLHISRCGWETEIGPGRHAISSAYFWYVKSPCGGLAEYYSDEDVLTEAWQPREFPVKPEIFAEWAVAGGIDGVTRRQARAG